MSQKNQHKSDENKPSQVQKSQEESKTLTLSSNPLNDTWVLWLIPRGKKGQVDADHYEEALKKISEITSIENFFNIYCYLKRPSVLSEEDHQVKLMFFRKGRQPIWEENSKGGAWIIMIGKKDHESLNMAWESLIFACLGETFQDTNVIGVVVGLREKKNMLEIWIKDCSDQQKKLEIGEKISHFLNIDFQNANFFFKNHQQSLKEHSSLQNAETYFFKLTEETPKQKAIEEQMQDDFDNYKLG